MKTSVFVGAFLTAAAFCAVAAEESIAKLVRIEGTAVVSKGAQYVNGSQGMALKVGERVMSLAASAATIQFNDGCRYVLEANQLLTIEDKSPCALGLLPQSGGAVAAANLGWLPPVAFAGIASLNFIVDTNDLPPAQRPISAE